MADKADKTDRANSVSAIVMAYNEVGTLAATVDGLDQMLRTIGCPYEIIIVDDGSKDGTGPLADDLAAKMEFIRIVHHRPNQGLGGVYRSGFAGAKCDFITFFPADGQFSPSIIEYFYPLMKNADMVLGYLPSNTTYSLAGKVLSAGERIIYRVLFGPLPHFQGILMFRRILLEQFKLKATGRGWVILMELIIRTYQSHKYVVTRKAILPEQFRPRSQGKSKVVNARVIRENLSQMISLRLKF